MISDSDSAVRAANGTSDWVAIRPGRNLVAVTSPTWGGTTAAALEMSYDGTEDTAGPVEDIDEDLVFSDNRYRTVYGPGYIRIVVTNIGAESVTLKRVSPA